MSSLARDERQITLVCKRGARAEEAASRLSKAGLTRARVLNGVQNAWEKAGKPIRRIGAKMALERQIRIGAGLLVVTGFLLAWMVNPLLLIMSAFVGCGLVLDGLTGYCGMLSRFLTPKVAGCALDYQGVCVQKLAA
ncbi:MAG: hypothetical protein Fur0032_24300 [Terrimicrobiaceae bacterium]